MKNKEKSCSFLDAIGRRSCGRSADWLKIDVGKPKLQLERIETAGWYATMRFVTLLWLALDSCSSLACLSSACISLGMLLRTKFTAVVSSSQSLTPPPSLSLHVTRFKKKNHFRSTRQSEHQSESSLSVATRSRSPGLTQLACSGWFKRKNAKLFPAMSSCVFVNDLRRGATSGNYMLSGATFVHSTKKTVTARGSVWSLWVQVNCTLTMSLWQCLLALSTNQPLLQQIWKLTAQTDVTWSGVLLQLCSRPSILLISSTIWCRFWLISTPLMSESKQRKNRRENCWSAAS